MSHPRYGTAGPGGAGPASRTARSGAGWRPGGRAGWRSARPELIIAAILVAVLGVAGYAFFGSGGTILILIICAVVALVALRLLALPVAALPPPEESRPAVSVGSFTGFFRKHGELVDGTTSISAYDTSLRFTLEHLLAARLSERHGISLYTDPGAARRLLCPGGRDDRLWFWIDPERPPALDEGARSGIPPRTLAALIDRLERL
jgi:hypothetical protein